MEDAQAESPCPKSCPFRMFPATWNFLELWHVVPICRLDGDMADGHPCRSPKAVLGAWRSEPIPQAGVDPARPVKRGRDHHRVRARRTVQDDGRSASKTGPSGLATERQSWETCTRSTRGGSSFETRGASTHGSGQSSDYRQK